MQEEGRGTVKSGSWGGGGGYAKWKKCLSLCYARSEGHRCRRRLNPATFYYSISPNCSCRIPKKAFLSAIMVPHMESHKLDGTLRKYIGT